MEIYGKNRFSRGFTIVELVTVVGIIAILTALLMPAMAGARRAAQATQCASNMRQIIQGMVAYSVEFKGKYPPNAGFVPTFWYMKDTLGRYIKQAQPTPDNQLINGVFVCPSDLDEAVRCYAMNVWASGVVSPFIEAGAIGPAARGQRWDVGVSNSSQMILLVESFSAVYCPENDPNPIGYSPPAVLGFSPPSPGERFHGGGGWAAYNANLDRFGVTASHIAYFRHRRAKEPGTLGDAIGRTHIGFADGHVMLHSDKDLYDHDTGESTFQAMWSPNDREAEAAN